MIRLPLFILVWMVFIAIKGFPLWLAAPFAGYLDWPWWMYFLPVGVAPLGVLVIPILYRYRYRPFNEVPKVFLPWLNPEDWNDGHMGTKHSLPQWWVNERGISFKSWFRYHAIRNPANGLRNFEFLDCDPDPSRIRFVTTGKKFRDRYEPVSMREDNIKFAAYLAWQGLQAGCKMVYVWNEQRHLVFKFGWRIEPRDRFVPIDPNGTRVNDAGFASKFLPYREG